MKERPIIFSTDSVQAIQADRKTVTRRLMKPQPTMMNLQNEKTGHIVCGWGLENGCDTSSGAGFWEIADQPNLEILKCPYGRPGDILWVRESFVPYLFGGTPLFKADTDESYSFHSPLFLPKKAARLWLEITDVRVEMLHAITQEQAIAEGCPSLAPEYTDQQHPDGVTPIDWYADLWDRINGPGSWEANPWVWVIEFKRIEKPKSI